MPINFTTGAQPETQLSTGGAVASGDPRKTPLAADYADQPTTKELVNGLRKHTFAATSCFWASVACFSTASGYGVAAGLFFGSGTLLFAAAASGCANDLIAGARVVTRKVNQLLNDIRDLKLDINHLVFQKAVLEMMIAGEADGELQGLEPPSAANLNRKAH